jgi:hypothetical protein
MVGKKFTSISRDSILGIRPAVSHEFKVRFEGLSDSIDGPMTSRILYIYPWRWELAKIRILQRLAFGNVCFEEHC